MPSTSFFPPTIFGHFGRDIVTVIRTWIRRGDERILRRASPRARRALSGQDTMGFDRVAEPSRSARLGSVPRALAVTLSDRDRRMTEFFFQREIPDRRRSFAQFFVL